MSNRLPRQRWLTEETRETLALALLRAKLPPEVAPRGYEWLRGSLWAAMKANRTVPDAEEFDAVVLDLLVSLERRLELPDDLASDKAELQRQAFRHLVAARNLAATSY